jgi:hypothetical protein
MTVPPLLVLQAIGWMFFIWIADHSKTPPHRLPPTYLRVARPLSFSLPYRFFCFHSLLADVVGNVRQFSFVG